MKRFALCIAVFTAVAVVSAAWAGENKAEPQLRLALDLVDGSHIIGIPNIDSVPVQTSYAKMDVQLKQLISIKMGEDHETASIELQNGDKLKGVVSLGPVKLETVFGNVSVGIEHIRVLRVVLAGGVLPEGLKRGLVLYYSFDRDEGGKATDLSGKGHDGIVHGAKWTRDGVAGGAYEFNGNGDYIDTGCNLSGMDEITVCGWVRPARAQRGASVVTQFGGPPGDNVWGLFAQADHFSDLVPPHKGIVTVLTADGRRPTAWGKPTEIGKWTHLCFTFKRNGQVVLFKDGVPVGQDAAGDSPLNKRDSTAKVGASWGADGYWANGLIDEVMIYNRALSGEEVAGLYRAGSGRDAGKPGEQQITVPGNGSADAGEVTKGQRYWFKASGLIGINVGGPNGGPAHKADPDGHTISQTDGTVTDPQPADSRFPCPGLATHSLVGMIGGLGGVKSGYMHKLEGPLPGEPSAISTKDTGGASACVQLGSAGSFVAPASGRLVLLCNDYITGDNSGAWEVRISR